MCLGQTTTSPSSSSTINWGRGPWDERPPIQVGEEQVPSQQKGKNVSSTNKNKSSLKAPSSQSSKNTGMY